MDFTTTPCGTCGKVSEVNENLIGCDGCEKWFHWRCVNATESDEKADKWFCPSTSCQQKGVEYRQSKEELLKKRKNGKKTAEDDNSDGESSDSSMTAALDDALKALQKEQKAKEREMEVERLVREKRLQMERTLKEKRMLMETDLMQKEIAMEQEIMTKALQEKKAHLVKIRNMRKSFNDQMEKVRKEIVGAGGKEANQDGTRKKANVSTKSTLQDQPGTSSSSFPGKGEVLSSTKVPVEKDGEIVNDEEDDVDDEEESDSVVVVDEEEDEKDDDEETDEKDDDEETDEKEDEEENNRGEKSRNKKQTSTAVPHGLGPTKAQLAARNGITRKLPIFTGKPEEWPLFIGSYNASNEACGFSDVENLVRLQESLRGPALEQGQI